MLLRCCPIFTSSIQFRCTTTKYTDQLHRRLPTKLTGLVGLGVGERAGAEEGRGKEETTQAERRHEHGISSRGGS